MKKPDVSVVMATYNDGRFLHQAIDSIIAQSYSDFELIVVDDASTDDSASILQAYLKSDDRIRYFRNEKNIGCHASFNKGIRYANPQSKFLIVFNSDDWWESSLLATLTHHAERNPRVVVTHSDLYRTNEAGHILQRHSRIFPRLPPPGVHHAVEELLVNCYFATHTTLINRERMASLYPTSQPFDPSLVYVGDYCLWLQLFLRGGQGFYVDEPLAYFRKHSGQQTSERNIVNRLEEEVAMFRYHVNELISPQWEAIYKEVISVRCAALAFELLGRGNTGAVGEYLSVARDYQSSRRLDVWLAEVIMRLPLPVRGQARLWNSALKMRKRLPL